MVPRNIRRQNARNNREAGKGTGRGDHNPKVLPVGFPNALSYRDCLVGVATMSNRYIGIETRRVKTEKQIFPPAQKLGPADWISIFLAVAMFGTLCALVWAQLS